MTLEQFENLDFDQQRTMMLAMHIRNQLENFHCGNIPDTLMPELNSTIRYAIHEYLTDIERDKRKLAWLVAMTPNYWEIPGIDPKPEFTGEYLWQGKPIPRMESSDD